MANAIRIRNELGNTDGFNTSTAKFFYRLRYPHWLGIHYTDGVKYLATQSKAFWLLDAIASHQTQDLRRHTIYSVVKVSDRSLMNSNDHHQRKSV